MQSKIEGSPAPANTGRAVDRAIVAGLAVATAIGVLLLLLAVVVAIGWVPGVARPDYAKGVSIGDLGGLAVAGATILLATFTATLAWLTRRSIAETQREATIADGALAAANRQAEAANELARIGQEQVKAADRQVAATNEQSRIAQEQLAASWRPLLVNSQSTVDLSPPADVAFQVEVRFVNIGVGPAFVTKGLLALGVAMNVATQVSPTIVPVSAEVQLTFTLRPATNGVDRAIAEAISSGAQLTAGALYHDISGERAWRSRGRLTQRGTHKWLLADAEVSSIELTFLN